ncbi:MAG: alpha-xylosidase [Clostridiales bacterium]|nr:alpha-xylosidase [Clostridiales bacterium]
MKFTNGYWMPREGYREQDPRMVFDYKISDTKLTLYAPFVDVTFRGMTLNAGMLTIDITSPLEGILRIQACHHKGAGAPAPAFALRDDVLPLNVEDSEEALTVSSGSLSARINKRPFGIRYFDNGVFLTESGFRGMGYVQGPDRTYIKEELSLSVGETVYGLGEHFTPFVKNGQTVDIWNEDGGTGSEQAYKNIPFYVTSRGYGVFVNDPGRVSYEVASEKVSRVQFSVPGETLDYCLISGGSMKQALSLYTALTGRPALPPKWSFGLWLSTSFTTTYNEETVLSFIDGMLERGIPLDVFHFDCCWMKEFEWCNFQWYPEMFPDPEGMIRKIHDRGIKVCCWINSYIGQKSPLFDEGMEKGYFLKHPDGSVWQWDLWQAGQGIVDFTNPEACAWYRSKLEALLDMGVDCFKTDFGERIPTDCVYYNGADPEKMHNYYTYLYNKVVFDLLEEKRGLHEAVLFARSATVGGQQFPVHWGGDCTSNYPSMAESLRGGLSFMLSGFGYWSHDIGGFEDGCEPDIYKRWTQFGLLSTHSRYHGSGQYKVPWLYGDEAVDVTRAFTKLKLGMMPYLYTQAILTHKTGIPMVRPMVLEFPEDETCRYLDRQYMLGDSVLVAPVFSPDGQVKYYLPEGRWMHIFKHEVYEGGRWYDETYDYFSLPVLIRADAVFVTGPDMPHADYDLTRDVTFHICDVSEHSQAIVCNDVDEAPATVSVTREGDALKVCISGFSGQNQVLYGGQFYPIEGDQLLLPIK